MFKNLAATDLVAARSPTSRRLLCNLAGTDRGPQSGCSVCLTGALIAISNTSHTRKNSPSFSHFGILSEGKIKTAKDCKLKLKSWRISLLSHRSLKGKFVYSGLSRFFYITIECRNQRRTNLHVHLAIVFDCRDVIVI